MAAGTRSAIGAGGQAGAAFSLVLALRHGAGQLAQVVLHQPRQRAVGAQLALGLRMCVDGEVPLGSLGTPSSKIARMVLSCAPASEVHDERVAGIAQARQVELLQGQPLAFSRASCERSSKK